MQPNHEFCVKRSRISLVLIFLLGLPLVAGCLFIASVTIRLIVEGQPELILLRPLVHFTGLFGVVFFTACMVEIVRRFIANAPDLCVMEKGLVLYPFSRRSLTIPWQRIEKLDVHLVRSEEFFSIQVRDPDDLYRQSGHRPPMLRWINRLSGFGDFSIGMRGTGMQAAELKQNVLDVAGDQLPSTSD
jgi:hypothetical protein